MTAQRGGLVTRVHVCIGALVLSLAFGAAAVDAQESTPAATRGAE